MDQYLGEIRMFTWNWPPKGWALCNGAILPIAQNAALFSLLGTTYGGNGTTTFALPDLQGRVPIHRSSQYPEGARAGEEQVTLTQSTLPQHIHMLQATTTAGERSPRARLRLTSTIRRRARWCSSTPLRSAWSAARSRIRTCSHSWC